MSANAVYSLCGWFLCTVVNKWLVKQPVLLHCRANANATFSLFGLSLSDVIDVDKRQQQRRFESFYLHSVKIPFLCQAAQSAGTVLFKSRGGRWSILWFCCPTGVTRCTDGDEIWSGWVDQISLPSVQEWGCRGSSAQNWTFYGIFFQNFGT